MSVFLGGVCLAVIAHRNTSHDIQSFKLCVMQSFCWPGPFKELEYRMSVELMRLWGHCTTVIPRWFQIISLEFELRPCDAHKRRAGRSQAHHEHVCEVFPVQAANVYCGTPCLLLIWVATYNLMLRCITGGRVVQNGPWVRPFNSQLHVFLISRCRFVLLSTSWDLF